jgi:hypothetical protein
MATAKGQFQSYAAKWAESFSFVSKKASRAIETAVTPSEDQQELERQLQLIEDTTVKHAKTLKALADR